MRVYVMLALFIATMAGADGWESDGGTVSTNHGVYVTGIEGLHVDAGGVWAIGVPTGQAFPNPPGGIAFLGSHKGSQAGLWLTQPGSLPLTPSNVSVVGNGSTVGLNAVSGGAVALELAANFVFVCTNGFCRTRSDGPTGVTDLQVTDSAINVTAAMLTDGGVVSNYSRVGGGGMSTDGGIVSYAPGGSDGVRIYNGARFNFSENDSWSFLYRSATDTIRTHGSLAVDGQLILQTGDSNSYFWRSAQDTISTHAFFKPDYLQTPPVTLALCYGPTEGMVQFDATTGRTTGKRTKSCICSSDGFANYAWQDLATGILGTESACEAP